jgi:transposase
MLDQVSFAPPMAHGRRQEMRVPDEVAAMARLRDLGWGTRRIAAELGCDRETVRRYLASGGWAPYRSSERRRALAGHEAWLAERFRRHRGNADVVRQEVLAELGITVSLRTVERAVAHLRRELAAEVLATVRFETPPGRQLQIDFGERGVRIGDETVRVHLFVATLGYSRRVYVRAFQHQRQSAWLDGIEGAFGHFGGVPAELLFDNAKALVDRHDPVTREVTFNERLHAFARYWGLRPVACAPYRARTKGKDERGVGYVKGNALAGRSFASWAALEAHLVWWMREIADTRVHGTTGEAPAMRFMRDEAAVLRPLAGRPPFRQARELTRRVQNDGCVDIDTNHYSVPWTLIGSVVSVIVSGGEVQVLHAGAEVARHAQRQGRRERAVEMAHLRGIVVGDTGTRLMADGTPMMLPIADLLRPLAEYEQVAGGRW